MPRIILLIFFLYILTVIQVSFLPYFNFFIPNSVLVLVGLINLWERPNRITGIIAAFSGGFFLDIFSGKFFGFWIIISIALAILIKYLFKKYLWLAIRLN